MTTNSTEGAVQADPLPSGRQYHIGHGTQHVVVTEVGATLRSYRSGDDDVVDGFGEQEICTGGRGQVLAPWPNRLGDGRYHLEGRAGRAALDEPERRNAIHGLVRWLPWHLVSEAQNVVVLGCRLHPQPAYPWVLDLQVEYRLGRSGLTVTTTATNPSTTEPAPVGLGFHPYLTVGVDPVDRVRLQVPARRRLVTDERGLPTADASVAGTELDFAAGRTVGPTRLDTAFTDLVRDDDGRAVARLVAPDRSRAVALWVDRSFRYLMVYTGDTVDPAARRRRAIAIEPMTCPPDAFRSGTGVLRLEPGSSFTGVWGIDPSVPPPLAD
ncbi:MAG: aldose 1-epimerase family protein [Actinomycetota bacterium]|nr:aldose 1-epimerase family protein [Actinomycetota bacterium]